MCSSICRIEDTFSYTKGHTDCGNGLGNQYDLILCWEVNIGHRFLLFLCHVQQQSSVHFSSRHEAAALILLCPVTAVCHIVLHHTLLPF